MIHAKCKRVGLIQSPSVGLLLFFVCIFSNFAIAQTFNGQGGLLIPPGAPGQTAGITTSLANVSGIGILGNGCVSIDNVTIDLTHTFDSDLAIFVIAPGGQVLELSSSNGGGQDNYTNSIFMDNTALFITQGSPPYTGTWRPEGRQQNTIPPFSNSNPLGTYTFVNTFNGLNADGDWTLMINDYVGADVGVLISWSITFVSGGGSGVTVDLGPDITICPGQTVTLTPTVNPTPDTYAWSTGESSSTITVSPAITTTYSVTVTDNGCVDQDTIVVIVNPNAVTANAGPDVTICQNQNTNLSGSGGGPNATYQWSSGQSGQNILVTPNGTTTYTLTVTDGPCSSTDQVIVNVTPNPIADAGLPVTICEGENTSLSATGGNQNNQYTWSTGQNGQNITISPTSTTTYTVTVNINGCTDSDDVVVTVIPTPDVNAGPPVSICQGETVTLTATGSGGTYQWSNGGSGDEITVSPNVTTTYTVTLTNNGCQATDQVQVDVTNVIANVTPDHSICEGESTQLTASGGTTYEWSTGQSTASISVSPGNTTIYSVTVSLNNCTDNTTVEVEVVPAPIPGISPDETICDGETVTLTASGGTDYEWSSGQGTSTISVSPGSNTVYIVTVFDQGCSSTATVNVDVNPAPNTDAGADIDICDGETATLIASGISGAGEYVWSTGETGDIIDVTPVTSTTYTVTATNSFNCSATDDVMVTVHPVPVVDAGADQSICEGNTVTLIATGGSGVASFNWSTGQTGSNVTFEPLMTATYTVTIHDGGCSSTDDVEVVILPNPVASAGADQIICAGQTATIVATGGGNYLWSTGENISTITVTPDTTTSYQVTVTGSFGCTDHSSMIITVQPLPLANAGPDQIICAGDNATLTGTGGSTLQWSTGDTTSFISVTPNMTTTYALTVSDATGCTAVDFVTVTVQPIPIANAGPNVFILTGGIANLLATGGGTYLWSTGETTPGISVSPAVTTTYSVTVSVNGCSSIDDVTVFVNEPPAVELGPDITICQGDTITIDASIQGPFMTSYLWSSGETTNSIMVTPFVTTQYYVTVTDMQSGFFSVDSITVTVHHTPVDMTTIHGPISVCVGAVVNYFADPVPGATLYEWDGGPHGTILSGSGTNSIELLWDTPGQYPVFVATANECGNWPQDALIVDVLSSDVLLGPIAGNINPCNLSIGTYSIPVVPDVNTYQWTLTGNGAIMTGEGTNSITIDWNGSTGGTLCVSTTNDCGNATPVCLDVVTTTTPVINAGQDFSICGLSIDLAGSGSGTWSLSSGAGTAVFNNDQDPVTPVTVSKPGTYTFLFQINENGCMASDEVQGDFYPEPVMNFIEKDCSEDHSNYTISFTISSGTPPYEVNGSPVLGTDFISNPIIAGASYSFQVKDVHGCVSLPITGMEDCACFKSAGEMDPNEIDACSNEIIRAIFLGGENLEPGDTLMYVLYDPSGHLGNILWNYKPEFSFWPPIMKLDSLYIISAVVGKIWQDGLPDPNDPCLSISEGTPVRFKEVPDVDLGDDLTISLGESVVISANSSSVIESYNWFGSDTCTDCSSISLHPLSSTSVKVEVNNADGCSANDELLLTVLSAKDIDFPNVFTPNGDQINDVIFIGDIKSIDQVQLFEIFDRWGNNVFRQKDFPPGSPSNGWDGSFKGKLLNPGVYLCRMTALMANGVTQNFTWDVTLVR